MVLLTGFGFQPVGLKDVNSGGRITFQKLEASWTLWLWHFLLVDCRLRFGVFCFTWVIPASDLIAQLGPRKSTWWTPKSRALTAWKLLVTPSPLNPCLPPKMTPKNFKKKPLKNQTPPKNHKKYMIKKNKKGPPEANPESKHLPPETDLWPPQSCAVSRRRSLDFPPQKRRPMGLRGSGTRVDWWHWRSLESGKRCAS